MSSYLFFYYSDYKLYIYHLETTMKTYTHCTLQDDKVLWWYKTLDWEGDLQNDFDVLEWWAVYPFWPTGAFIAEQTRVSHCIWSYTTEAEALQAICDRCNDDEKRWELIEKAQSKFVWVSLDEAYKDVNPVWTKQKKETPKSRYLDRLREKAKPYSKFTENLEKVKSLKATMQRKFYGNQYDYLLDH